MENPTTVGEGTGSMFGRFRSFLMRRKWLIGAGAVLVVAIAAIGYVVVPPPKAHSALRGHTVQIAPNAEMRVIFSQWMDHASSEKAFSISPFINGNFSWDGPSELVFKPAGDLTKGAKFMVTVNQSAKSWWMKQLVSEYQQEFEIVDFPSVAVSAPANESEINQDQVLSVLFDRPYRILSRDTAPPDVLKFEPTVKGTYHWLGSHGFEFVPDGGWPAARKFKVTIPKGTKMADGGSITSDVSWSFYTPALRVWSDNPGYGYGYWYGYDARNGKLKPKDAVRFEFNYPVEPNAVRDAIVITANGATTTSDQYAFAKDKDNANVVLITKPSGFELGTTYEFKLQTGFTGNVGLNGLANDFGLSRSTDTKGFLARCSINGQTIDPHGSAAIVMNNPIEGATASTTVTVTPSVKNVDVSVQGWLYDANCQESGGDGRVLTVNADWKPSTTYTITLGPSTADIYGQQLGSATSVTFTTDAYRKSAELASYGEYGMLAGHLPRIFQIRTMNLEKPITTRLCSGSFEAYASGAQFECAVSGERSFDTKTELNHNRIIDIDLDSMTAVKKLPTGYYRLDMNIPEVDQWNSKQERVFVISDTALTLKRTRDDKLLVWAVDMKTGDVVPNLTVEAYKSEYKNYNEPRLIARVANGKTGTDGTAWLTLPESARDMSLIVRAFNDTRLGYAETSWDDGISPWNYNVNTSYGPIGDRTIGFVYTDRRIYRPDQIVYYKGVVRLDENAKLKLPKTKEVLVTISDPDGKQVDSQTLPISAFGTFHGQITLNPSMSLGSYIVRMLDPTNGQNIVGSFDVREYRKPDFKVTVEPPTGILTSGSKIPIKITGAYYHGTPLANAAVNYELRRTKLYYQPMKGEWYSYTENDSSECYWYCPNGGSAETVMSGDGKLDASGVFTLNVPANLTDYPSSASYSMTVTVVDVNKRGVSANIDFPVHKGEFYVGIRANYDGGWSSPNLKFDLATLNPDESIRTSVPVTVTLYKRTWVSVRKEGTGSSFYDYEKKDDKIETKSAITDGKGASSVSFTAPSDGEFVAVAEAKDSRGNRIAASENRYVYRGGDEGVRVTDDHQMKIVQTKADYKPGETATLAVQTPYVKTKALVTVERDAIRETRVIDLGNDKRTIDVTIDDASAPNIFVSVLAVKGGGDASIPEFRLGYANLQVNTTQKVLNMKITPDKLAYKPREKVTLTIETKKSDGTPVSAETSVAVVDERVVALLGSIDRNILGAFWFPRTLGVYTAQSLTRLVIKVFFATEGGAGDGKGGGAEVPPIRGNFLDTAYWKADVVTGADGKATVTFELPDNLTSWQILAIGTTKDTIVGTADATIVTRRDLMAEPIAPRILRYEDTATLGATVHNNTDRSLSVTVTPSSEGLALDTTTRKITLAPKSRQVVTWSAVAPKSGKKSTFTVRATGDGLDDGFVVDIPLFGYSVPEIISASGILDKNITETVRMPDDVLPHQGELDISVAPSVSGGLQKGMEYLLNYEYGCSEQTTSAVLASVMYRELVKANITKSSEAFMKQADDKVTEGIRRLVAMHKSDGGWGLWPESDRTYAHFTAYVFWGLTRAEKAGYAVDKSVMDSTAQYLRDAFGYSDDVWGSYGAAANEKAQVLFMLSERNPDGLAGYAATLYDKRKDLSTGSKAFLAMAYGNIEKGTTSAHAATLMGEIRNKVVRPDPTRAYITEGWEYWYGEYLSSDLSSTSLYLQALLRQDPKNEDVERLVHYLMTARFDGYWYSTHDTAMSLIGLVDYVKARPADAKSVDVDVFLNNAALGTLTFPADDLGTEQSKVIPLDELKKRGTTYQVGIETESEKKYLYDVSLKTFRQVADIQAEDNGFGVTSEIFAISDKKHEHPISSVALGDTVRVRMKILVPKERRYVAVENHLPAGLEAIDFSLHTSPQNIAGEEKQCAPSYWGGEQQCFTQGGWGWDWWWENVWKHIEFRDDRVFLFSENLRPGVYEYEFIAQAMTPGTFRVPPARAYEFYNPSGTGHSEGKIFTVTQVK